MRERFTVVDEETGELHASSEALEAFRVAAEMDSSRSPSRVRRRRSRRRNDGSTKRSRIRERGSSPRVTTRTRHRSYPMDSRW